MTGPRNPKASAEIPVVNNLVNAGCSCTNECCNVEKDSPSCCNEGKYPSAFQHNHNRNRGDYVLAIVAVVGVLIFCLGVLVGSAVSAGQTHRECYSNFSQMYENYCYQGIYAPNQMVNSNGVMTPYTFGGQGMATQAAPTATTAP